ncbi:MAG: M56 and MltD domain-containing protein [Myxococcota bacterium]
MSAWWSLQAVVVALCAVSEWAVRRGGPRSNRAMRGLFVLALLVALAPRPGPAVERLVPLQVAAERLEPVSAGVSAIARVTRPARDRVAWLPFLAGAVVLGALGLQIAQRARLVRGATPLHRVGSVSLAVSPHLETPCALWLGRTWILLDPHTATDPARRDLAVRHEVRHVRHGDVAFAWLGAALLAVCAPNPFAWRLVRNLAELDEHAVDHALVHGLGVSARQYGRLLLDTATRPPFLQTAPGLAPTSPLNRRLTMLASARPSRRLPWLLAAALVTTVAFAGTRPGGVPEPSAIGSDDYAALHIPRHAVVDTAVDRLLGTPKGRAFFARALERRPAHHGSIAKALDAAGLPAELEAIVLVESGYDDQLTTGDLDSAAPAGGPVGAGLWMFIPSTARTYGLRVDAEVDERLDPTLETEAALALLTDLHDEFGDWGLALAGYNQGAAHVRRAIAEHGTHDVPTLVEAGALNRYVPTVWAAMLAIRAR